MRLLFVTSFLPLVLSTAGAAPIPEGIVVSVRSTGAVLVPASVNGQGPVRLLLDTGASHSAVSQELADRLSLPVVATAPVVATGGVRTRLVVRVASLAIGTASVEGLLPSVVPRAELRDVEPGIDGIVGQDFLSVFNYTIEYRERRLLWIADPCDEAVRMPLTRAGDRALVSLSGTVPVMLVPDSGSEVLVVFARGGRTALAVDYLDQPVEVSAVAARQIGRRARVRELTLGASTLRNQLAVVVDRNASSVEGDGLLPLHRFSRVTFNNKEGWMSVR